MFNVNFAVYGALAGGDQENAQAANVTSVLSRILNDPGATGIVRCDNTNFPDASFGNKKHFGALVNNRYFACEEGQTIDFNNGGGTPNTSGLLVRFAVYGALPDGDESNAQAVDVTATLQSAVDSRGGVVTCDNGTFGDPSFGNGKHFAAVVNRGGTDFYFACIEGQTIDFNNGGGF